MSMRCSRWLAALILGAFFAAGTAGPAQAREAEVYGGLIGAKKAAKRTKKQKAIDRHLYTAQYLLMREGDLAAAAREHLAVLAGRRGEVLALDRGNVHAGLALAQIELQNRKPKQAVAVLTRLSKKAKKEGAVWRALAEAHRAAGNDKGLEAACARALELDPRDGEAHWILFEAALARHKAGDSAARAGLEAAARGYLSSGTLRMGTHRRLAERTLIELTNDEVALLVFDAKNAYQDAFTENQFGAINRKMAEARRGFERCVKEQPDRQECHYHLGLVYGSVKASEHYDPKKAAASLRRAPDLPEARVELARLHRVSDDLDAAARELAAAIKLAPHLAQAHLELGVVRKLDGNEDAAVQAFVKAYEADRYSAAADRAVAELSKLRPRHPLVTGAMMFGDLKGDVFSTDRFKAAVQMVEQQLGGVEEGAPEQAILEEILSRLRRANDVGSQASFRVQVLKSSMVNAFALPDGSIYFTRGMFDFLKKKWPNRPIDARHDVLGHIMGHEMAHVLRRHTVRTLIFQEAQKDAARHLDPAVLTHVTRLHEIEADRDGIVLAFLAGYHPRGGIEFMEVSGQEMEIPAHLDHPTYEERVHYLEEYWTNDVKYGFQSFRLGLDALRRGGALEARGAPEAAAAYEQAVDHFKRFRTTLKPTREVLNNLGIAYAKLGVMAVASSGSPLSRWQTRFSIEQESSLKYAGLVREESGTRGGGNKKKAPVPWQLREAIAVFEEALQLDPGYLKARLNLALVQLALGRPAEAGKHLARIKGRSAELELVRGVVAAEQRQWAPAIAAFQRAGKARALTRAARYNLARAYQLAGKKAEAKAHFQAYIKADKASPWGAAARRALKKL